MPYVIEYPQDVLSPALCAEWIRLISCLDYAYNAKADKGKKAKSAANPDYPAPTVEGTRILLGKIYAELEADLPEKNQVKSMMHRIGLTPPALPDVRDNERQL